MEEKEKEREKRR